MCTYSISDLDPENFMFPIKKKDNVPEYSIFIETSLYY